MVDYRSADARLYRGLYNGKRWRVMRDAQLSIEPLCRRIRRLWF